MTSNSGATIVSGGRNSMSMGVPSKLDCEKIVFIPAWSIVMNAARAVAACSVSSVAAVASARHAVAKPDRV